MPEISQGEQPKDGLLYSRETKLTMIAVGNKSSSVINVLLWMETGLGHVEKS
jgi:hypothetical protein